MIQKQLHYPVGLDNAQLSAMLSYNNENVISRFTDMFHLSEQEAEGLFTETKKFLFICQLPGVFIPEELLIIDEMWHNFILFTKDYQAFCTQHFGIYFHHLPATKNEKALQKQINEADPHTAKQEYTKKLRQLIAITYDYLGENTVVKWFKEYPFTYSRENIKTLRRS